MVPQQGQCELGNSRELGGGEGVGAKQKSPDHILLQDPVDITAGLNCLQFMESVTLLLLL